MEAARRGDGLDPNMVQLLQAHFARYIVQAAASLLGSSLQAELAAAGLKEGRQAQYGGMGSRLSR